MPQEITPTTHPTLTQPIAEIRQEAEQKQYERKYEPGLRKLQGSATLQGSAAQCERHVLDKNRCQNSQSPPIELVFEINHEDT